MAVGYECKRLPETPLCELNSLKLEYTIQIFRRKWYNYLTKINMQKYGLQKHLKKPGGLK